MYGYDTHTRPRRQWSHAADTGYREVALAAHPVYLGGASCSCSLSHSNHYSGRTRTATHGPTGSSDQRPSATCAPARRAPATTARRATDRAPPSPLRRGRQSPVRAWLTHVLCVSPTPAHSNFDPAAGTSHELGRTHASASSPHTHTHTHTHTHACTHGGMPLGQRVDAPSPPPHTHRSHTHTHTHTHTHDATAAEWPGATPLSPQANVAHPMSNPRARIVQRGGGTPITA